MNAVLLPVAPVDVVRQRVRDYLALPESFPQVIAEPRMEDRLNERFAKAERRRFTGEPMTGFGGL